MLARRNQRATLTGVEAASKPVKVSRSLASLALMTLNISWYSTSARRMRSMCSRITSRTSSLSLSRGKINHLSKQVVEAVICSPSAAPLSVDRSAAAE